MEWDTAILSGLFTGIGVILAQRLMAFLDRHPLIIMFKRKAEDLTHMNEKEDGVRRKR